MKILMVTSETVPFSKSGGLADVVGSLSAALVSSGHEVRILMPMYSFIPRDGWKKILSFQVPMLGSNEKADILEKDVCGVRYLGLSHPYFSERKGIYGDTSFTPYPDNCPRFILFAKSASLYLAATDWPADIVHCHDWTTGLVPHMLKRYKVEARTVFTIHNLAYQGVFPLLDAVVAGSRLRESAVRNGCINMLAAGIRDSDFVTTVSPSYMEEIRTPLFGCGLDPLLLERGESSIGIINGVGTDEWNPETDTEIVSNYSASDISGKRECKRDLLKEFGLPDEPDKPLFAIISRLAEQKGFEELLMEGEKCALERIIEKNDCNFVIVGTGDGRYVTKLSFLMAEYPNLSVRIAFSQPLSHKTEAGADFFLMPSRFEPCGLNQLYSMRYGTVPVVHAVGGLKDTVRDISEEGGTGISFETLTADEIVRNAERAKELYRDRERLEAVIRRSMETDFSWDSSARKYIGLYASLLNRQ